MKEKITIDAEKLARSIWEWFCYADVTPKNHIEAITKLITDSIDLNITWKDDKAEWGIFKLSVVSGGYKMGTEFYNWELVGDFDDVVRNNDIPVESHADAIKACEQALWSVVCGVKS